MMRLLWLAALLAGVALAAGYEAGRRVLLDAHNCYPEQGKFADRIARALDQGVPVAIEQDLYWYVDPATGAGRSVVSHGKPLSGDEPGMKEYFFERVRPVVERALGNGDRTAWPLIVLNLDFKTEEPEHLAAVWRLLEEYKDWLTAAPKLSADGKPAPLAIKPLLVLTGVSDAQERAYFDAVADSGQLLVFGAVRVAKGAGAAMPVSQMVAAGASNYRRWWNNPWAVVEEGGQRKAGEWTKADDKRLRELVRHAHRLGLWIRFYTLNGHAPGESQGWSAGYNFGSLDAVRLRWRAAVSAGVDFIATDQYEELAREVTRQR